MEAQQLQGLGPKLCQRLTGKMEEWCQGSGVPMPELPYSGGRGSAQKRQSDGDGDGDEDVNGTSAKKQCTKKRAPKPYTPAYRSGPWALMIALLTLRENAPVGMTRDELIELAQPNCDANFQTPNEPGKFYTAWNSMKTLVAKDMVHEHGRPLRRYMLTDEGREIAVRLQRADVGKGNIVNHLEMGSGSSMAAGGGSGSAATSLATNQGGRRMVIECLDSSEDEEVGESGIGRRAEEVAGYPETASSIQDFTPIYIAPGTFDVQLVLDNREIRSTTDRDYISEELAKKGVKAITRALPVGDALWVARIRNPPAELLRTGEDGVGRDEVVLDYIVERKRLDDLIGSIKDGRFHEQKFRLQRSGVKNVTYLVENFTISEERQSKMGDAVASAIASTQVVNGFFVKRTEKIDATIRYLVRMTKVLQELYEKRPLYIIPPKVLHPQTYLKLVDHLRKTQPEKKHYVSFASFHSLSSKSEELTLRDLYLKMLMCCRGVTGEKALEIQRRWKTPREFYEAFEQLAEQRKKDTMVSEQLQTLVPRKKIAKALSTKIAEVWAAPSSST